MAVGTLGMTGGTLTQDKIDKLKAVDVRLQLNPIDKRATANTKKQNALESFVTKLSLAKGSTSSLSDDATYLKRSASTTNSAVSVKVDAGVKAQSISLEVNQLAQQHVMQSRSFSSTESQVSFTDTTFDFNVNGNDYSLEVSGGTTLSEMAQLINDSALSDITASVIDTGNGNNRLIIRSVKTGDDNQITFTNNDALGLGFDGNNAYSSKAISDKNAGIVSQNNSKLTLGIDGKNKTLILDRGTSLSELKELINNDSDFNVSVKADIVKTADGDFKLILKSLNEDDNEFTFKLENSTFGFDDAKVTVEHDTLLQNAQNAKFKYNGVDITRPTNVVDDIVLGLELTLNEVSEAGKPTTINVTRNDRYLLDQIDNFVSGFNSVRTELDTLTKYDSETKEAGVFQGDGSFNKLKSNLGRLVLFSSPEGKSIFSFGFDLSEAGVMTFDNNKFNEAMKKDPESLEKFFRGSTKTVNGKDVVVEGLFSKINNLFKDNIDSSTGSLTYLEQSISKNKKSFQKEYEKTKLQLDARYEIMTKRYAAYASKIGKLNSNFSTINMIIQEKYTAKS